MNGFTLLAILFGAAVPAWAAARTYAYITNRYYNDVAVLNWETGQLVTNLLLPTPAVPVITPDGKFLYLTSNPGKIATGYIVSTTTNQLIRTIPLGKDSGDEGQ